MLTSLNQRIKTGQMDKFATPKAKSKTAKKRKAVKGRNIGLKARATEPKVEYADLEILMPAAE